MIETEYLQFYPEIYQCFYLQNSLWECGGEYGWYADNIASDKSGYPHNIFLISAWKHML